MREGDQFNVLDLVDDNLARTVGRGAVVRRTGKSQTKKLFPRELFVGEAECQHVPRTGKVFAVHPAAMLALFAKATEVADQCRGLNFALDEDRLLTEHLMRLSDLAFRPGATLRSGHERVVESIGKAAAGWEEPPDETEYTDAQMRLLAAHCVLEAIGRLGE